MKIIRSIMVSISILLLCACQETRMNMATSVDMTKPVVSGIKFLDYVNANKQNVIKIGSFLSNTEIKARGNKSISFKEFEYKGAKVEIFSPKHKKNSKVIYWIHGGAYLYPLSNIFRDAAMYMISLDDSYDIAFVDYSILPNARYPQANQESEYVLEYLEKHYSSINMLGDSAGGNLVLSTLIKRKDERKPLVKAVALYSPFLDIAFEVDSRKRHKHKDILIGNPYVKDYVFEKLLTDNDYYQNVKDKKHPYISPNYYENFKDFPPVYIEVGKDEVLYDDSYLLAQKLDKVTMVTVSDLFHDFQLMIAMKPSRESLQNTLKFFNKYN